MASVLKFRSCYPPFVVYIVHTHYPSGWGKMYMGVRVYRRVEYTHTRARPRIHTYKYVYTNTLATERVHGVYAPSTAVMSVPLRIHIGFEDCIFHGPMKTSLNTSLTIVYNTYICIMCVGVYVRVRSCTEPLSFPIRSPLVNGARVLHTRIICKGLYGSVKNPNRITPV